MNSLRDTHINYRFYLSKAETATTFQMKTIEKHVKKEQRYESIS